MEVLPEKVILRRLVDWQRITIRLGKWSCGHLLLRLVLKEAHMSREVAMFVDSLDT